MLHHPSSEYQSQAEELTAQIASARSAINRLSVMRLIVFTSTFLLIYLLFNYGWVAIAIISLLEIVAFLILVKQHVAKQGSLLFLETKLLLIKNEISNLTNGENLYPDGSEFEDNQHPYTADLDIFGKHSLFAHINRCHTAAGMRILAAWFKSGSTAAVIKEKQLAVSEISASISESIDFRCRQKIVSRDQHVQAQRFLQTQLSEKLSFLGNTLLLSFLKIVPYLSVLIFIAACTWSGIWWNILGIFLLINAGIYFAHKKAIDQVHESSTKLQEVLKNYATNLQWLEAKTWQSEFLLRRRKEVCEKGPVSNSLKQLSHIVRDLDYRLNIIVGIFLNLFFLWDLRCLQRLSVWEKQHFGQLQHAMDWLAEFEALSSLASFDHNYPKWVYPLVGTNPIFSAADLGHPLIADDERVLNNFSFIDTATTDIITGSNMAGKSTFLRTVGINLVLAYAGAKVCASHLECGIFKLVSYMRIRDSLAGKTSTFKAEIDRLKMILDYSNQHQDALVLIDEMLRGTNSRDKYLGSKAFVEKLISQNTHAFVATHDLQVAELEKTFPQQLRNFHFDISLTERQEMYFDYKIKTGECKTFNASILLKTIGLEISENE